MTGLRARQKANRNKQIVTSASGLFRKTGFENTKIETIAERAQVSVGTIYNYFESKGDLLVAVVSLEVNEVLNAGESVIAAPPDDVMEAITLLIDIYLDHSLYYLDKDMWRNAMALATSQPTSPSGRKYNELDERLSAQVGELIEKLRRMGRIKANTDTEAVGGIIFNATNMMFTTFVKTDTMSLEKLKSALARQIKPLAEAIRI